MDPRFAFRKGYDTDLIILRSLFALNPTTNQPISSFYTSVADGIGGIQWLSPTEYFSCATGILNFVSSVQSFSTITGLFSNFSTQSYSTFYTRNLITSTISTFFISSQNVTVSTLTFFDTLGNSSQTLGFSAGGLYVNGQILYNFSTLVAGLGSSGYISSSQFLSTIDKLGSNGLGYVNTPSLVSTTTGLQGRIISTTIGLLSTINLTSNYAFAVGSTTSNYALTIGIGASNFASTIGSNTSNYANILNVSSLVSTTFALKNSFYVQNANTVYVNNASLSISSVGTFIFFSSFMNSSITYQGNSGQITGSNPGGSTQPLFFSSATLNLDRWSSFINAASILTLEAYPTFLFANLGLGSNPTPIYMSSFVQAAGSNFLSSASFQSVIYPTTFSNNQSNLYNQPIKITMRGADIQGFYPQATYLAHYLPNAITTGTTQGFSNSNVSIFLGSTNSVFLSIQNLPL